MRQTDGARRNWRGELSAAGMFLTRLPMRVTSDDAPPIGTVAWAFPLVGLGLGLASGLVYSIGVGIGLSAWLAAAIAIAAQIGMTGALHEDGLADVADGFGGGHDPLSKLSIMRDSRIGAYGVLALILALAARIGALAALADGATVIAALMVSGAASRTGMATLMRTLPPAREDGLGHESGQPDSDALMIAFIVTIVASILLLGVGGGIAALIGAGAGALWIGWLARRQIGGQTGDVFGACQQTAEIACLCAIVAAN